MKLKRTLACMLAALCCAAFQPFTAAADAFGDMNADGEINAMDATLILRDAALAGAGEAGILSEELRLNADINEDKEANAIDATIILMYAAAAGAGMDTGDLRTYYQSIQEALLTISVPDMIVGKKNEAVTISWTAQLGADGYEIYRAQGSGSFSLLTTISSGTTSRYDDTGLDNDTSYYYKMRAFRTKDGVKEYTDYCAVQCSSDLSSILNAADLVSHTTFPVYNRQKSEAETTSYNVTLSENDIAILEAFAAEHFPADATREDKLWITLYWIHTEVDYAYAGELWNEIADKSWTEAIFVNKKGQCAQYNGAMAAMMAYLGYDVSIVQGWRGTYPSNYWQHFWVEVDLGGLLYIMECGNLGKNGDWYYFVAPYEETSGYIRNCINM